MIKIKKILCFFLIGILILSLSACGKDKTSSAVQNDTEGATDTNGVTEDAEGNDKEEGAVGNGVTGDAVENVTEEDTAENDTEDTSVSIEADYDLAKLNVFRGQTIDLGDAFNHIESLDGGEKINDIEIQSLLCTDNRIFMIVEDYTNFFGDATVNEEDIYYGKTYYLVSVNQDGSDKRQQKLEIKNAGNEFITFIQFLQDGSVVGCINYEKNVDPENRVYGLKLYKWNSEGNTQWITELDTQEDKYDSVKAFVEDKDGNLVMVTGENQLYFFDKSGKQVRKKEITQGKDSIDEVITKKDGSIFVITYDYYWGKMFGSKLDVNTASLGDKVEFLNTWNKYSFFPGETSDFILTNNQGLYTYNIGDAEPVKFMDYINSDVESYGNLFHIDMLNENEFVATYYDLTEKNLKLAKFTYVDPATLPDRITLVVGCDTLDNRLAKRIIDLNKTSDKYRFTVKDYGIYNTTEDYTLSQTQMNNDIISGNMPDIMLLETSQNISSWANKGLLADVGELIAKDEELSQNEYLNNVFKAFSVNDKLYAIVPSYYIRTMIARKDVVGDRTGWTMTEFAEFMKSQPKDVKPFGKDTIYYKAVMDYIMGYCGNDFVDWNTGECSFDSQEFVAILEFAKSFPAKYNLYYEGIYRDKKAVMMNTDIYGFGSLLFDIKGELGDEAVFVGFPVLGDNSSYIVPSQRKMIISAKSKNPEAAWELIRYYLTEEYQTSDQLDGLPVLKKVLYEEARAATERPKFINNNRETEYYDFTYWYNEEEIILEPFTQKEADAICDFICSVDKPYYYDENITNIVLEEAGSYFAGSKSAKDVAQVIQSRVQLYVDENR